MRKGKGFIAALDQSGGSTPKALKLYGVDESAYSSEEEMFNLVHQMRTRIMTSPVFTSARILAVILFEETMNRAIDGSGSAQYLWLRKGIIPFLKIDNGLLAEVNGAQLMKPIPQLEERLISAKGHGVFGTKMRSLIKLADQNGIEACIRQQFQIAEQVLESGLMPILEPEIDINSPEKSAAEAILKRELIEHLNALGSRTVMLKLTLPDTAGFYTELTAHPAVLRVVALSGGYSRDQANAILAKNPELIASFSRALTEGLKINQSETEFNEVLDTSIQSIYKASVRK